MTEEFHIEADEQILGFALADRCSSPSLSCFVGAQDLRRLELAKLLLDIHCQII